MTFRETRRA